MCCVYVVHVWVAGELPQKHCTNHRLFTNHQIQPVHVLLREKWKSVRKYKVHTCTVHLLDRENSIILCSAGMCFPLCTCTCTCRCNDQTVPPGEPKPSGSKSGSTNEARAGGMPLPPPGNVLPPGLGSSSTQPSPFDPFSAAASEDTRRLQGTTLWCTCT